MAIMAALLRRASTGEGSYLDVSITDGVLSLMSLYVDEYLATGTVPGPGHYILTGRYACYDTYRCADDKWVAVGAIEPQFYANLCRALRLRAVDRPPARRRGAGPDPRRLPRRVRPPHPRRLGGRAGPGRHLRLARLHRARAGRRPPGRGPRSHRRSRAPQRGHVPPTRHAARRHRHRPAPVRRWATRSRPTPTSCSSAAGLPADRISSLRKEGVIA